MKILIIEDEYNLDDAIKAMLLKKKYDVTIKTAVDEVFELKKRSNNS